MKTREQEAQEMYPPDWAQGIDENAGKRSAYEAGMKRERERVIEALRTAGPSFLAAKDGTVAMTGNEFADWLERRG